MLRSAFAAHALQAQLSTRSLSIFETAARYQMYHSLALLLVAILLIQEIPQTFLLAAGWLFVIGIVVFSGSLYALSLTDIKVLGAITPLGGVAFIGGWVAVAIAGVNFK